MEARTGKNGLEFVFVFMRKSSGWGFGIKVGEGMLNQRMKGETKKLKTDGRGQASDHGHSGLRVEC